MRKKSLLLVFVLVIGFALTITGLMGNGANGKSNATVNAATVQVSEATVTMRDIARFLEEKNEHYPLSDEFIERYQQTSGGYIDTAKKAGRVVDKQKHEPNQKWHFFESWFYPSIDDGTLTLDSDARSKVYINLKCPELLLWIYEACNVNPSKVRAAKDVAEQGKVAGTNVATIAKNMRECVAWEDLANTIQGFEPAPRVTLSASKLNLTVGENATITATVQNSSTASAASWSITEGDGVISITANGNEVTVNAIAKGTAKIKVTFSEDLSAECTVTVSEPRDPSTQTSAKYSIEEDLGTGKRSKTFATAEDLFAALKRAIDGDGIITSVSQIENIYGGGYGGSGENAWYIGNVLKLGTTSVNGSITFTLNAEVSRVIISGYVSANTCKIQVGDSASTDWTDDANDNKTTIFTCSDMSVASKEIIEGAQTSTITIDFESASSITIATTNKKPFYITSIEFVVCDTAQ